MGISITIDDLDGVTVAVLQAESRRQGVSVSDVARDAIRRGLPAREGMSGEAERAEIEQLIGTWTQRDVEEFNAATESFRQVDPELWK